MMATSNADWEDCCGVVVYTKKKLALVGRSMARQWRSRPNGIAFIIMSLPVRFLGEVGHICWTQREEWSQRYRKIIFVIIPQPCVNLSKDFDNNSSNNIFDIGTNDLSAYSSFTVLHILSITLSSRYPSIIRLTTII